MNPTIRIAGRLLPAVLALGCTLGAAAAPAAVDPVKVERLMQTMGVDKMLEQIHQQYSGLVQQAALNSAGGATLSPDQRKIVSRHIDEMSALIFGGENRKQFRGMIAQVYATQFTAREIDDMTRFYESESGRSIVAKMPQVTQRSTEMATAWLQTLRPEMDALVKRMQKELRDCAKGCPTAAPKKAP